MNDPRRWGPIHIKTGDDEFVETVRRELNRINQYAIGRAVFQALDGSDCVIEHWTDMLQANDNSPSDVRIFGPNRPVIGFDPEYCSSHDFEPTTTLVRQRGMTCVYLFHELVHAWHISDTYWSPIGTDPEEEFRTTGLYRYTRERLSENSFRRQAGLPRRFVYNWTGSSSSLPTERRLRMALDLPADPQNYVHNIEDNFAAWDEWFLLHRQPERSVQAPRPAQIENPDIADDFSPRHETGLFPRRR